MKTQNKDTNKAKTMPEQATKPRMVALKLLHKVLQDKKSIKQATSTTIAFDELEKQDKAFCLNLVQTSLRFKGELTHLYKACLKKSAQELPPKIEICLIMGGAQLLHLNTPAFAAINESVKLCKALQLTDYKNLINAVLHRMDKRKDSVLGKLDKHKLNTPNWLYGRLKKNYSQPARGSQIVASQPSDIMAAMLQYPTLDLYFKTPQLLEENLKKYQEQGINCHKLSSPTVNNIVRLEQSIAIASLSGYDEGHFWVQDIASSTPILALEGLGINLKGKTLLDMCAAPGGKAMQAASLGAVVTANDSSAKRLEKVTENFARTKLKAEILNKNALQLPASTKYDIVLLDAPCTGTGTIAKSPEILHTKNENDILEMAALQKLLLKQAQELCKPSGVIIYSTCSLLYEENLGQLKELDKEKILHSQTILPHKHEGKEYRCNGFFFAVIKA